MESKVERYFTEVMSQYGTRWQLSDENSYDAIGLEELRAIFRFCISTQKRALGPLGFIHFDLLDNSAFNALASNYKSYDFLAIFSGVFFHMYRLFFCFLSDPKVLPSLGNISNQHLSQDILNAIRSNSKTILSFQHPFDDTRYYAAQNLALVSCLLVLNHEIGHIVHCHPQLVQKHFNLDAFEEIPTTLTSTKYSTLRKAFELEADEYAGHITYIFLDLIFELLAGVKALSIDYVWSAANFMLFLCMYKQTAPKFDTESQFYPAPRDRWLWMIHQLSKNDKYHYYKPLKPNDSELMKGTNDVVSFWQRNNLSDLSERNSGDTLVQIEERINSARRAILEYKSELDELENIRNKHAKLWYESHESEVNNYKDYSLKQLANFGITRPKFYKQ